MYIERYLESDLRKSLKAFPVTAIIGPRQCGKSTLAKRILENNENGVYLDLERPSDLHRLAEAELYLSSLKGKLVCIDEIQRKPDLFPLIRSLCDEWGEPGAFLILGSVSRDLLRQSSESLAGRIAYHRLTPFLWKELGSRFSLEGYWNKGAFPGSLLAADDDISFIWRENFIQTFLERDLRWWSGASPEPVRRLWAMLAHSNGQTVNYSRLGASMGMSDNTIRNYVDLLASTFMLEIVPSYRPNTGKRTVKSPKAYIADSGVMAALLGLKSYSALYDHPAFGSMWEQIVLANIRGLDSQVEVSHYRTAGGAEIDFVVAMGDKVIALECKASLSPALSKGTYAAADEIGAEKIFVVAPVREPWLVKENVEVINLDGLPSALKMG